MNVYQKSNFGTFYREHVLIVVFFVQKHFGIDRSSAEEIAQESFLKVFQNYENLKDFEKLRQYTFVTAKNEALSFVKKSKRNIPMNEQAEQYQMPLNHSVRAKQEVEMLGDFLASLDDNLENNIFKDFYLVGRSTAEIAQIRKMPISTITTKLSRMRQKFKVQLLSKILKMRDSEMAI